MRRVQFLCVPSLVAGLALAQATFEVASVKPSAPLPPAQVIVRMAGGPGTADPGRMTWENVPLSNIIRSAFAVPEPQQLSASQKDRPLLANRYDIAANVPQGTSRDQFNVMLQNFLAARFKLAVHHEMRNLPVYRLVVAKSGLKAKESAGALSTTGGDGFPEIPPNRHMAWAQGPGQHVRVRANGQALSCKPVAAPGCELFTTIVLRGYVPADRILEEDTGLTGVYDFKLEFVANLPAGLSAAPGSDGLSVFDALEQQLGLKLEPVTESKEVLVLDHVERPTSD